MKKTVNHILAAGLLALLSLASCTDEFIEGNDLQGVDRDKRVEVRLPFGVGPWHHYHDYNPCGRWRD